MIPRVLLLMLLSLTLPGRAADERPLFNGKDLTGWEGDLKLWTVQDGAITRGEPTVHIKNNDFLATTDSFQNFDLKLKIKLTGIEGFVNSGIQIRSVRVPNHHEMSGYQADAGKGWWGKIYDETRRNKVIAEILDQKALDKVLKPDDWNDYRIRAEGRRIQIWVNGVQTADYTETADDIASDGHIGLQLHGGAKARVQFKDITITELPPSPDLPTWKSLGGYKPYKKK